MITKIENTASQLNYWTPVKYGDLAITGKHRVLQYVDSYFHLNGPVAVAVFNTVDSSITGVELQESHPELWLTILKIISYATIIIPAIMLIAKYVLRSAHSFYLVSPVLPDETKEQGTFVNGAMQQGIRVEGDKTIYVKPKLLLEELRLDQEGIELNFVEVVIDGQLEVIPVQKPYASGSYNSSEEYVRYSGSANVALLKMATREFGGSVWYTDRHNGSPVKYILQHANNHQANIEDFLAFLVKPNEKGELPIQEMNYDSLVEVLELAEKKGFIFDAAVIDALFNKYATQQSRSKKVLSFLLELRPEVINQTVGRDISFYSQAILQGHINKANILLEAMNKQHIVLTPTDVWIQKAMVNDCDFTQEEFLLLPPALRERIYQVANMYMKMEFVQKLRDCGMREAVAPAERQALFSYNMDAIDIRETLVDFLRDLRHKGLLLTEDEFNLKDHTQFYEKGDTVGRILGKNYIEKTAERLGLTHVKVPRKTVMIQPKNPEHLSFTAGGYGLRTSDLIIYAERISRIERKAAREEMLEVLTLVEEVGFNDFFGDNFWIGRNAAGEEGVFCIDTEYHNFSSLPSYKGYEALKCLMHPKDHEWLEGEIARRRVAFEQMKAEKKATLEQRWEGRALIAEKHGFWDGRKFTLPINEVIPPTAEPAVSA